MKRAGIGLSKTVAKNELILSLWEKTLIKTLKHTPLLKSTATRNFQKTGERLRMKRAGTGFSKIVAKKVSS